MKDPYVSCYFSGRFDAFDGTIDTAQLVEKIESGLPLRDVTMDAARRAIDAEMTHTVKLQWINDNKDDIASMGGNAEKAWMLYGKGRADALASSLEEEVLNSIEEDEGDEEDEDEGGGDEGEEDEEDDDEEDDDDEEEDEVAAEAGEPEAVYVITDEKENELLRRPSRTAAKRLALKLVREGKYRHLEVHHIFRGRLHMQGQATSEGWSDV
jgi:hypothetical protein